MTAAAVGGRAQNTPPAGAARGELRRRITWILVLRTVVISLVLALTLWVSWVNNVDPSAAPSLVLLGVVGATYLATIIYSLLLRGGVDPARLIWPQIVGDLAVTSVLVHVTGGAQSAYTFFFALSIIGAAAVHSRWATVLVTQVAMLLLVVIALSAWQQVAPLPSLPPAAPQGQTPILFLRSLGLNLATLVGVGVLGYLLAGELRRTEASLASERRVVADLVSLHQDIVRSLTSGLVTVDLAGHVLTVNHHAAELLGVTDALGRDVDDILPGLHARLDALATSDTLRRADLTLTAADRTLVLGISVSPLRDLQDVVVGRVINFTDLTELRRMSQQVKHAERMATIGQLAAGIAHEIRNPLASMSGSIELLQHAPAVSEDDRALMAIVIREIDRLNALITDLLDYASPRPRQPVPFDFAVMIRETVQVFRQDRGLGGVEIAVDVPARLELTADPAKLRQVVWNLLRNAAEAAGTGGGHVRVMVRDDTEVAVLELVDDGPGIPSDVQARVFDPFFTTKSKGTGLGLATCQNVITEHGGTITVHSGAEGTRFVVSLPRGPVAAT